MPEGTTLETPAQRPLSESDLPPALRELAAGYRKEHAGDEPVLVKYMRIVDGEPELVVEDEADLPPDDELLTLSQTVTLNDADRVHVVTDLFVARRR